MFKITIIGSWDTLWTPVVWCKQPSCLDNNPKSNRYRFGLLIEHKWTKILVDTNPDLKWQCIDNNFELRKIDHVLITHTHSDHINGMWEFFYRRENPTIVHHLSHPLTNRHIDYFGYLETEWVLSFRSYENYKKFSIWEINITPIELNHGFPCSWFIIEVEGKQISIVSDSSVNIPGKTKELIKDSDVLFIDSFTENMEQVTNVFTDCNSSIPNNLEENWFHMTIEQARLLSKELNIEKTYTVHMSRYVAPHEILVNKYESKDFIIGYDGLKIEI